MKEHAPTRVRRDIIIAVVVVVAACGLIVHSICWSSATSTTCASNLREIGRAMAMYTADNDNVYPPAYTATLADGKSSLDLVLWAYRLSPYTQSNIPPDCGGAVFDSWGNATHGNANTNNFTLNIAPWHCPDDNGVGLSYSVNPFLCGDSMVYRLVNGRMGSMHHPLEERSARVSDVANAANEALCADGNHYWNPDTHSYTWTFPDWVRDKDNYLRPLTRAQQIQWYAGYLKKDLSDYKDNGYYPQADGNRAIAFRHDRYPWSVGSANVLFCDGHVKSVKRGDLGVANVYPELSGGAPIPKEEPTKPSYGIEELGTINNEWRNAHCGGVNDNGFVAVGASEDDPDMFCYQNGKLVDIGRMSGTSGARPYAVNNHDTVVGDAGQQVSFIWKNGKFSPIDCPNGWSGVMARGINNRDQVVGRLYTTSSASYAGSCHAFLWENGVVRDLGVPKGCISSAAYAINNAGQIVGEAVTTKNKTHAFLWQKGVFTDLGTLPGGTLSSAYAINNKGQIVGDSNVKDDGVMHPVMWENGKIRDLGLPANTRLMIPHAINDNGLVACQTSDAWASPYTIKLWDEKHGLRDLRQLLPIDCGWQFTYVLSMNNKGAILGWGDHGNHVRRLFLATPSGAQPLR